MTTKPVPLSLRKKSSARLASVQCIYRVKMNDEQLTPEELFEDYMRQWKEDKSSPNRAMSFEAPPDKVLFLSLMTHVIDNAEAIHSLIQSSLGEKWKIGRMSPVLIAILACAIVELKYIAKVKPASIINEYVTLTGRFFDPKEVGFVNGLLDALAKLYIN
jgi:N utilization substance protein B